MKKHFLIQIIVYNVILLSISQLSIANPANVDWQKLFDGDMMIETLNNKEKTSGIKLMMTIEASKENIWKTLTDYEHFSHVFKGIDKMKVLEEDDKGAYVEFWIDAVITKYHYILYRHYEKPLRHLTWKQVSGDMNSIEGSWEIHNTPRSGVQLLIYTSYVQFASVVPKPLLRWGAIRKVRAMGRRLRDTLEALPSKE